MLKCAPERLSSLSRRRHGLFGPSNALCVRHVRLGGSLGRRSAQVALGCERCVGGVGRLGTSGCLQPSSETFGRKYWCRVSRPNSGEWGRARPSAGRGVATHTNHCSGPTQSLLHRQGPHTNHCQPPRQITAAPLLSTELLANFCIDCLLTSNRESSQIRLSQAGLDSLRVGRND